MNWCLIFVFDFVFFCKMATISDKAKQLAGLKESYSDIIAQLSTPFLWKVPESCYTMSSLARFVNSCYTMSSLARFVNSCYNMSSLARFVNSCYNMSSLARFVNSCYNMSSLARFVNRPTSTVILNSQAPADDNLDNNFVHFTQDY